jgi:Fe-S-cluster containining protein
MNHPAKKKKVPTGRLTPTSRPAFIDQCQQCGICCTKGGPALHKEDAPLIERGAIPTKSLFTLRKGEMAIDNVVGHAAPLEDEIIKIKGRKGAWTCCFYNAATHDCQIYDTRPVECRVLACWDTADIERIYARNRLTRQDLLGSVSGLWDVVQTHEQRCAYRKIEQWVSKIDQGDQTARAALNEMIAYDRHLRSLTVEKSGIDPALLDFLFGRPLSETLAGRSGK